MDGDIIMLKIRKMYLLPLLLILCTALNSAAAENEDYIEVPLPEMETLADKATQLEPVFQEQPDEQKLVRNAFKVLAETAQQSNGPDLSVFKNINRILDEQKITNITLEQYQSGVVVTLHTSPSNIQFNLDERQTAALRQAITQILQPQVQNMPTRQPANQQGQTKAPAMATPNQPNGPTPPDQPNGPDGSGGPNGPQDPHKKPEEKLTKEEKEKEDKKKDKERNHPALYDPRLLEQNKDKASKDKKNDPKKDDPSLNNQPHSQQYPAYPNYYPMQDYQQTPRTQQQPKAVGGSTGDKTAFATQTPKAQVKAATFEERQALVADGTGKIIQTENRVPEPSNQPRKQIIATPEPLQHQKVTDRTSSLKVVLAGPEEPVKAEQPKPQPELTFFETVSQKITNFFLSCWQFMVNLLPFGK